MIRAGTIGSATAIGRASELGSIEPGKFAGFGQVHRGLQPPWALFIACIGRRKQCICGIVRELATIGTQRCGCPDR
jgi:hypothetical protein